ncbi:MAG: D-glycero-beta-D-manno-heptose 1-phosphate adenylyltransferase [Chitinophagaceae bacterium]
MRAAQTIQNKLLTPADLLKKIAQWKVLNKSIAFTNGCFDILHQGHIASLMEAASHADFLIVGLNTDDSVKKLKGPLRPINKEQSRALVLAALCMVDAVVLFGEDTPRELIIQLKPDVLVKGGDYKIEEIAGATEVQSWGGKVVINPTLPGYSTTDIINRTSAQ